MNVEVVLVESDPKLGTRGQVVKVSQGYAYNFLFPHNKAKLATPANLKSFKEEQARLEKDKAEVQAAALISAQKISQMSLTLEVLTGEGEKLYGAITSLEVQKALADKGIALDRKAIHLEEPIKKLGVFQVPIKLHSQITASLKISVIKKKG